MTLFRGDATTPASLRSTLKAVRREDVSLLAASTALSGGLQRRLALTSQLLRHPQVRVILLEEPLAGVNGSSRRNNAVLRGAIKVSLPVAVVTHQPGELLWVADHRGGGGCVRGVLWSEDRRRGGGGGEILLSFSSRLSVAHLALTSVFGTIHPVRGPPFERPILPAHHRWQEPLHVPPDSPARVVVL